MCAATEGSDGPLALQREAIQGLRHFAASAVDHAPSSAMSSSQNLQLRYEHDCDGSGELFAEACCGAFSGAGSAWFRQTELLAFGESLYRSFPIPAGTEIRLEGGWWKHDEGQFRLADVRLGLRVYPLGLTGTVAIRVELAEGDSREEAREDSQSRARFEICTGYEEIRRFGAELAGSGPDFDRHSHALPRGALTDRAAHGCASDSCCHHAGSRTELASRPHRPPEPRHGHPID